MKKHFGQNLLSMLTETFDNMKGLKMNVKELLQNTSDRWAEIDRQLDMICADIGRIAYRQQQIMVEEWRKAFPGTEPDFSGDEWGLFGRNIPSTPYAPENVSYGAYIYNTQLWGEEIIGYDEDGEAVVGAFNIIHEAMINGDEGGFRKVVQSVIANNGKS